MKNILYAITLMVGMFGVVNNASAYASLAIDSPQGSRWGFAYDYANAHDADQRALSECGSDCRVVKNFAKGCGAYAADQSPDGTAYGWGLSPTKQEAQNIAMRYCRQYGGTECLVRVWACNTN